MLKSLEKLYLRPNSVYCAEVTRSCKTSRCASMGLFTHPTMRQSLIPASKDIAGLKSFIYIQNKKFAKLLIKILDHPRNDGKDCHSCPPKLSTRVSPGGSVPCRNRSIVNDGFYVE